MRFESAPSPESQIGAGGYKKAYLVESGEDKMVRLVFRHEYTVEQMKGLFYLNHIATLLFPDKICRVIQAQVINNEQGQERSEFYSEYIDPKDDEEHIQIQKKAIIADGGRAGNDDLTDAYLNSLDDKQEWMNNNKEIQKFLDEYEEAGFTENFGAFTGWGAQDMIKKKDGGFVFVDIDVAWDDPDSLGLNEYSKKVLRFDPDKLRIAIDKLDEKSKLKAHKYLDRLIELCKQVGIEID